MQIHPKRWLALAALLTLSLAAPEEDRKEELDALQKERFFATYATTTYTVISAKTSTVFLSCLSGTDSTVCKGRKHKRRRRDFANKSIIDSKNVDNLTLNPSLEPDTQLLMDHKAEDKEGVDSGRFGLTIWTTTQTTSSITVFYTNTASTVRLSFYCVAGGMALPDTNCKG